MTPEPSLLTIARDAASKNGLDPAIVCAVIEQESAWDCHAMRYEGAFRARYVAPLGLPATEEIARSISWGLMQVMGQVAREHGFDGRFLSALCEPDAGVSMGCVVLAAKLELARMSSDVVRDETEAGSSCISACRTAALGCITIGSGECVRPTQKLADAPDAALEVRYRLALQLWNGGANADYAEQVMKRVARYR